MNTVTVRSRFVLAAAIAAIPLAAFAGSAANDAGYAPIAGQEFFVSTSGATAFGAFTRATTATATASGSYTRSTFSLGTTNLRIGKTVYTRDSLGQFFALDSTTGPDTNEPALINDRVVYQYLERGSVNGLKDLIESNGLKTGTGPVPPYPTLTNPLWQNGNKLDSNGASGGGYTYSTSNPQGPIRIAWSDSRFQQGLSIPGTGSATKKTKEAGYGLGRGAKGGANFQQLASSSVVNGGVDDNTTYLQNQTMAMVGFNIVANPGTGLGRITKDDGKWLFATGRLVNGANFNVATRDAGSGTRNVTALNLGLDPSWAAGERDRVSRAATYNDIDPNGATVTITQGVSEANPERGIRTGTTVIENNERRVSPTINFADKTGGGLLREAVFSSRLGVGVLGQGDANSSTGGTALASTTNVPLRALAVDSGNGAGFNQAKNYLITNGKYEIWGAEQAITVSGTIDADGPGAGVGSLVLAKDNATKSIYNDQDDEVGAVGSFITNKGINRKFINNITDSGTGTVILTADTSRTPAEAILAGGFLLPQLMGYDRAFDGETQTKRFNTPSGRDAEGDVLYAALINDGAAANTLNSNTNWANPTGRNGNLAGGGVKYNIYAQDFAGNSSDANADVSLTLTSRTVLVGDMDNDGVRDIGDTALLAKAYASTDLFVADAAGSMLTTVSASGAGTYTQRTTGTASKVNIPGTGTIQLANANLVALTDFNSNGNLPAADGTVTMTSVERKDIRYFLYGATVDTSAYNNTATYSLNGSTVSLTVIQNRQENGVRLGALKKNAAIGTFNAAIDALNLTGAVVNASTGTFYTATEVADLKFSKFDVNGSDQSTATSANGHKGLTIADAKMVNDAVGLSYTNFDHVMSTDIDLVATNLNDSDTITTHILSGGNSDFKEIREALGTYLLDGDANFDGTVSSTDFDALVAAYGSSGNKWSNGDFFGYDGKVNTEDFNALAGNFGLTAPVPGALPGGSMGSVVPEPASMSLLVLGASALLRRRR